MSSSDQKNQVGRKGNGSQKAKMVKIANKNNRQVTFSKRRAGLFKKASELSTLCGAETAVIVFSPGNKPYSFGNPSVNEIANRFLGENAFPTSDDDGNLVEARHKVSRDQIFHLNQIQAQLEFEKKLAKELDKMPRLDTNKLSLHELERLHADLLNFEREFEAHSQNYGMNFGVPKPNSNLNLGKKEILQYPSVGGSNVNVPFINNETGATRIADMLTSGNRALAIGGSSSNPGPNRGAPSGSNFTIPFDPMVGRSCPSVPYSSGSGGYTGWYKAASGSSDVIPYSNEGANDEEASV